MKYYLIFLFAFTLSSCTTAERGTPDTKEEKKLQTSLDTSWGDHYEQLHLSKENPESQKWNLGLVEVKPDGAVEIEDLETGEKVTSYPKKFSREKGSIHEAEWIRRNFTIHYLESSYENQTAAFRVVGTTRTTTRPIGIGLPIAEEPSHTTTHTDP